jgi:hypothetical protein
MCAGAGQGKRDLKSAQGSSEILIQLVLPDLIVLGLEAAQGVCRQESHDKGDLRGFHERRRSETIMPTARALEARGGPQPPLSTRRWAC